MMGNFGPHADYIFFAYLGVTLVTLALVAYVARDSRRQKRRLAELEAEGVRRRSARPGDTAR